MNKKKEKKSGYTIRIEFLQNLLFTFRNIRLRKFGFCKIMK